MADATWKTYRHRKTGLVKAYHPRVASVDPNLVEVPEGTKPLTPALIPREKAAGQIAAQKDTSDEGKLLDDKTKE